MGSTVYFANLNAKSNKDSILAKMGKIFEALYNEKEIFKKNSLVGVKVHFGEIGLTTFQRPVFARTIVERVKDKGGNPFLFDTTTLYLSGNRTNAANHITTAIKNGFSYATVGAPIVIADGVTGLNCKEIETNGKHIRKAKIAGDLPYMDAIICLSHAKGHCAAGFGGALKNISMGMASRAGKLEMHSATKPFITSKCVGCGTCIEICPVKAISLNQAKARINNDTCIGCMGCDSKCYANAIKFNWDNPENMLMERMAEYAHVFSKIRGGSTLYFNLLFDITPDCDCYGFGNAPIAPDIGVLASFDPVAIDQASIDLINKGAGKDIFMEIWPSSNYEILLEYAKELGIGIRDYKIIEQ